MLKKLFNRKRSDTPVIDRNIIPQHVAIIMDGNGRWANAEACRAPWGIVLVQMY